MYVTSRGACARGERESRGDRVPPWASICWVPVGRKLSSKMDAAFSSSLR